MEKLVIIIHTQHLTPFVCPSVLLDVKFIQRGKKLEADNFM